VRQGGEARLVRAGNAKECKPLPLPQIHVIAAPEHGSLTVRTTKVTTNQSQNCPNLRLPARVLLYKSEANYVGSDLVSFTVTFENGEMQGHQISILVAKEGEPSKAEEL
jgi:predicted amino acid racemase